MTLKPCPFCGSEYPTPVKQDDGTHVVSCDMCQSRTFKFVLVSDAIEMWNTRSKNDTVSPRS